MRPSLPWIMAADRDDPDPVTTELRAECETCGWTGPPTSAAAMAHAARDHPGDTPTFKVSQVPRRID